MKVIQMMATISIGDAVSNDAIALKKVIRSMGFDTQIYAENIDGRLPLGTAEYYRNLGKLSDEDIIIFHESVGTDLHYVLRDINCHLIMRYHNITPPDFFEVYSYFSANMSHIGLEQAKMLSEKVEYVLADSEFNKQDLIRMGYHCPIDVLPVVIPFSDYEKKPDYDIIEKYNDDLVNLLFVGRVVPNKKHEDVIRVYDYYKKNVNYKSRLFLVGNYDGMKLYKKRLDDYIKKLGAEDVIFPGHIKFEQILSFYKLADIFLCMSEHEGFCVPIVEAMKFQIPIIAYDSCAVGDTLGAGGILLKDKDPKQVAFLIDRLLGDRELVYDIRQAQQEIIKKFSYDGISNRFKEYLNSFIEKQ